MGSEHTIPDKVGCEAGSKAVGLDEGAEACLAALAYPQHCCSSRRAEPLVAVGHEVVSPKGLHIHV
jgi:hypothetical protein